MHAIRKDGKITNLLKWPAPGSVEVDEESQEVINFLKPRVVKSKADKLIERLEAKKVLSKDDIDFIRN